MYGNQFGECESGYWYLNSDGSDSCLIDLFTDTAAILN